MVCKFEFHTIKGYSRDVPILKKRNIKKWDVRDGEMRFTRPSHASIHCPVK